jgi:hypothetical protein
MIKVIKMIRLFDSVSVECFCLFCRNNNYLEYLSAEVGKIFLVKKAENGVFCDREVWKWFGLSSFEAML